MKVQYDRSLSRAGTIRRVIDQVQGQDGWILPSSFFVCLIMDRDEVEVHKLVKKERGQYPAILTEQTWSIKDLLYGFGCILLAGYSGQSRAGKMAPSCLLE